MIFGKTTLGKKTLLNFRQNNVRQKELRQIYIVPLKPTYVSKQKPIYNSLITHHQMFFIAVLDP
jgi:hypothetical protein